MALRNKHLNVLVIIVFSIKIFSSYFDENTLSCYRELIRKEIANEIVFPKKL